MSALTDFFRALLKDAETEEQINTEPTEPSNSTEPKQTQPVKSVGYDEVERLRKELEQAQKLNRELLNSTDVTNNQNSDFSSILREQSYHPLYSERR